MKIGILTTGSKHEDERLVEAATSLGHEADLLKVLKCSLRVSNKEPKIFYEGQDISGNYDIIIPRINLRALGPDHWNAASFYRCCSCWRRWG